MMTDAQIALVIIIVSSLSIITAAFAFGFWTGHQRGFDKGWSQCMISLIHKKREHRERWRRRWME